MSTEQFQIKVSGLDIDVVRKAIKNLHLGVYPPSGRVRVAAPTSMSDDAVRLAVINRLSWIKKQRAKFQSQPRQSERKYITGETHYYFGRGYRLSVVEGSSLGIRVVNRDKIELTARPCATAASKKRFFDEWLRTELKSRIGPVVKKWEPIVGVKVVDWRVKRMKTKWGSCNFEAGRIWLNLELARKPVECLEYIVLHEMIHLIEPTHNFRFKNLMKKHMSNWQIRRDTLNRLPVRHEDWSY